VLRTRSKLSIRVKVVRDTIATDYSHGNCTAGFSVNWRNIAFALIKQMTMSQYVADTIENLTNRGAHQPCSSSDVYDQWTGLALRGPHTKEQPVTEYKSDERKKIADAGYRIFLNVGDQLSELNGNPQAERSVKLPNPFYHTP